MDRAKNISPDEILEHAKKAVIEVLGENSPMLEAAEIGIFKDIGTVGLRWRDDIFKLAQPRELHELSLKITEVMGPVISHEAVSLAAVTHGGVTAGYFPPDPQIREFLR